VTYGCSHYLTEEFERTVRDNYFICGSGIFVASILCNGDIYSCMDIERRPELVQGNIYTDDFVDVWHNRFQIYRKDRSAACAMCRSCEDRTFCCGDAAHTWNYDTNEPLLCAKHVLNT
jgi:radical SAM protein with 4Fe4S-binding SPASM domain